MLYDLSKPVDVDRIHTKLEADIRSGRLVSYERKEMRTTRQNSYLHLLLGAVAIETGNGLDFVKQEYFKDDVDSIGMHVAKAFVEIENTGNVPLYLHDAKFDIEDNDGHLLKTESLVSTCPDAILPGEFGYFYADYIDLDDVDDSNGLKFVPNYKIDEAKHEIVDYETSDVSIREDDMWKCMISGRLTNTTDEKIGLIYVSAIYYDADGNVLGISGTNLTDVEAGATESFEIIGQFFSDDVSYSDIADYKVIPRAWYIQF